jgi:hypothetical protein
MKTPICLCLALAGVSMCLQACDTKESPARPAAPAATSAAQATAPPPVAALPPPVAQQASADIDVAALQKQLGCSTSAGKQACRILAEFAEARRFTGDTPSGDGKWFGNAYTIEKKAEKNELMIFCAKRVGTAQIGPSDLPIRVGFGTLPEDKRAHGQRLAAALSRSDVVGKNNQALPFVKNFTPTGDRGVVPTSGASVRLIADETVYVREAAGQKVLLVRPSTRGSAAPGDGTYAELWLATW